MSTPLSPQEPEKPSHPRKPITQRHANRMALVQFLYMAEINPPEVMSDTVRNFFENQDRPREYYQYAEEVIDDIQGKLNDIDEKIQEFSQNWKISRISKTDLAILRLGIYELLYRDDIPPIVAIDEAIELSREFSTDQSNAFINGILDQALKSNPRPR